MYILIFGRDPQVGNTFTDYTVLARAISLEEISKQRSVSGDLVFNEKTREIVKDPSWLFNWEKEKPDCYANEMIGRNCKLR